MKPILTLALIMWALVSFSQDQYLHKSHIWINDNLPNGWSMNGLPKITDDGVLSVNYKLDKSEDNMTFYFNNCDTCPRICKQVLAAVKYSEKNFFEQKFDSKYKSIGLGKWGDIEKNIYIEFDQDFYKMDLLFITIKPIKP